MHYTEYVYRIHDNVCLSNLYITVLGRYYHLKTYELLVGFVTLENYRVKVKESG